MGPEVCELLSTPIRGPEDIDLTFFTILEFGKIDADTEPRAEKIEGI
jgi:hypothetical protein